MQRIPSIYDYLGQGIQQGIQGFQEKAQRDLGNKMQTLGLLNSMYQTGALPSGSFQQSLSQSGVPGLSGVSVLPSKQERIDTIIKGAKPEEQKDLTYGSVGLTNPADTAIARRTAGAQATSAEAQATVNTAQASVVPETIKMQQAGDIAKELDDASKRYVSKALAQLGGRIDPKKAGVIAQQAFDSYMQDRKAGGFGMLPDTETAKAHFGKATQDALIEQRKLDIQSAAATNGKLTPEERLSGQLITLNNNTMQRAEQLFSGMGDAAKFYLGKDPKDIPELYRGVITQYYDAVRQSENIKKALTTMLPKDIQAIMGQGATQAPPPAAGTTAPPMSKDEFAQAKNLVSQLPESDRKAFMDRKLKAGSISQDDYNKIISALGIK